MSLVKSNYVRDCLTSELFIEQTTPSIDLVFARPLNNVIGVEVSCYGLVNFTTTGKFVFLRSSLANYSNIQDGGFESPLTSAYTPNIVWASSFPFPAVDPVFWRTIFKRFSRPQYFSSFSIQLQSDGVDTFLPLFNATWHFRFYYEDTTK